MGFYYGSGRRLSTESGALLGGLVVVPGNHAYQSKIQAKHCWHKHGLISFAVCLISTEASLGPLVICF